MFLLAASRLFWSLPRTAGTWARGARWHIGPARPPLPAFLDAVWISASATRRGLGCGLPPYSRPG